MRRIAAFAMAACTLATQPARAEDVLKLISEGGAPTLSVRHQPGKGPSVLFVHGATFPAALSIAYRIEGRSWMDDLSARGFDVWAFDMAGYGGSDRPAGMADPGTIVGTATAAAAQIERVAAHIARVRGKPGIAIVAHSWGTIPAGMFAAAKPDRVTSLVLFGPVAQRSASVTAPSPDSSFLVSAEYQWRSFQSGVPAEAAPLIDRPVFDAWVARYLADDPQAAARTPPAALVPAGPQRDFAESWSGRFPYDPAGVRAPTLIVRGEWDAITTDADAAWLIASLANARGGPRDVKLPKGAHRMHLEKERQALFDAVGAFLAETAL